MEPLQNTIQKVQEGSVQELELSLLQPEKWRLILSAKATWTQPWSSENPNYSLRRGLPEGVQAELLCRSSA